MSSYDNKCQHETWSILFQDHKTVSPGRVTIYIEDERQAPNI